MIAYCAFIILAMALLWISNVSAVTINAASCSQADVQRAVNSAQNGDTVSIPPGSCQWAANVSWSNKNISVIGAGIGNTTITANSGAFDINATTKPFRISGFTFTWSSTAEIITLDTTDTSTPLRGWRIDHVRFQGTTETSSHAILVNGISYGLVDHCTFDGGGSYLGVHLASYTQSDYNNYPTYLAGREAWSIPTNLGTDEAVYIEDSVFNFPPSGLPFVNDMVYGARMVFRYNTVTSGIFQSHSARGGDRGGALKYEVYNNRWIGSGFLRPFLIRSGTGVIFNNTVSGYQGNDIHIDDQRIATESGCSVIQAPLNACNGSSSYDGNVESNGWPCIDQIGRGAGVAAGAAQPSIPLYAWNNGTTDTCATGGTCNNTSLIGINGACSSAAQWIKSTGSPHTGGIVDYVNNGTTPKPGYTPYIYPHPLQGQGLSVTLAPPQNLRAIP